MLLPISNLDDYFFADFGLVYIFGENLCRMVKNLKIKENKHGIGKAMFYVKCRQVN